MIIIVIKLLIFGYVDEIVLYKNIWESKTDK